MHETYNKNYYKNPSNIHFGDELRELKKSFREQVVFHVAYKLRKLTKAKWKTSSSLCDVYVFDPENPSNVIAIQHVNTGPTKLTVCLHLADKDSKQRNKFISVSANMTADKTAQNILDNPFTKEFLGLL